MKGEIATTRKYGFPCSEVAFQFILIRTNLDHVLEVGMNGVITNESPRL